MAQNLATGKLYTTATEALQEAYGTGATIQMIADSSESVITVSEGLTLDAHGKQLYMESFAVHEDFIDWMVAAKEEYDRQNPAIEVDGTGAYTVPQ